MAPGHLRPGLHGGLESVACFGIAFVERNVEVHREAEVTWCHSLSGEMDYTMQVVMPDLKHYTSFLMDRVLTLPGVVNVKSAFVLEKVKETTVLPLTYIDS